MPSLTICEKVKLIRFAKQSKNTQQDLVKWVSKEFKKTVDRTTISKILKCSENLLKIAEKSTIQNKRSRNITFSSVDSKLYEWVMKNETNIIITEAILMEQATRFANAESLLSESEKMTRGWILSFKKRHGIKQRYISGESGSVNQSVIDTNLPLLQQTLSGYSLNDIFNFDETSLFYRLEPSKTLATKPIYGRKKDLERITIGLCTNASGTEKLKLLIIGKFAKPRCFKNINLNNLGIIYRHNKKAWMTSLLFKEWITGLDNMIFLQSPERRILMIMDNATCHTSNGFCLKCIKIAYLPPNTISILQPLDTGIIRSLKAKYRSFQVKFMLNQLNKSIIKPEKLTLLDAIRFITRSWDEVTSLTIYNCWLHCKLIIPLNNPSMNNEDFISETNNETNRLQEIIQGLPVDNQIEASKYIFIEETISTEDENEDDDNEDIKINENNTDSEHEEDKISPLESLNACKCLIKYLEQQPENNWPRIKALVSIQRELDLKIEKNKKQTSLLDYFK